MRTLIRIGGAAVVIAYCLLPGAAEAAVGHGQTPAFGLSLVAATQTTTPRVTEPISQAMPVTATVDDTGVDATDVYAALAGFLVGAAAVGIPAIVSPTRDRKRSAVQMRQQQVENGLKALAECIGAVNAFNHDRLLNPGGDVTDQIQTAYRSFAEFQAIVPSPFERDVDEFEGLMNQVISGLGDWEEGLAKFNESGKRLMREIRDFLNTQRRAA
jgi:hypothetical protein